MCGSRQFDHLNRNLINLIVFKVVAEFPCVLLESNSVAQKWFSHYFCGYKKEERETKYAFTFMLFMWTNWNIKDYKSVISDLFVRIVFLLFCFSFCICLTFRRSHRHFWHSSIVSHLLRWSEITISSRVNTSSPLSL